MHSCGMYNKNIVENVLLYLIFIAKFQIKFLEITAQNYNLKQTKSNEIVNLNENIHK